MGFDSRKLSADFDDDFDEYGEPGPLNHSALERLKAALGEKLERARPAEAERWEQQLESVHSVGLVPLLGCLRHPDPVVRRITAYLLTYVDDDITTQLLNALADEQDAAARMALLVSLADRDAGRVLAFTEPGNSDTDRLGAAYGLTLRHRQADPASRPAQAELPLLNRQTEGGSEIPERVLDALVLCAGPAGRTMTMELPWAEGGGSWALWAVQPTLPPTALRYWLQRMLDLPWATDPTLFGNPGSLVLMATHLYQTHPDLAIELVPRIIDLVATTDLGIVSTGVPDLMAWFKDRKGPDGPIPWDRGDRRLVVLLDQLANLNDRTPTLGLRRILVAAGHPRAEQFLLELVDRRLSNESSEVLGSAAGHATALTPPLVARFRQEKQFDQLERLVDAFPDKQAVRPELTEKLLALLRFSEGQTTRNPDVIKVMVMLCQQLGRVGEADPAVRAALLTVGAGSDLESRAWAARALMDLRHPADEVVPILVSVITDHPRRSTKVPPNEPALGEGGIGLDYLALMWIDQLGPAARAAEPVLRTLLSEVDPSPWVDIRVQASKAWFKVTGDAETAVRVLVAVRETKSLGDGTVLEISLMTPVLPILNELAAEGSAQAARLAAWLG
ncbi:hypothetical protein GCM10009554_53240 [Kribbella koreensis]|uniref:HEAT repeat protein n=1 Tax=Kribbella koreensis TaxID=57909 RepID=A0ABN1R401_9ACTN